MENKKEAAAWRIALESSGCVIEEHKYGQWNVRKGDRLVSWYPFSKKRKGGNLNTGQWESDVDLDKVLQWLGCGEPAPVDLPGEPGDLTEPSTSGDAGRLGHIMLMLGDVLERLDRIEARLSGSEVSR